MPDELFENMRAYQEQGLNFVEAATRARLDHLIEHWPEEWGSRFHVLLHGYLAVTEKLEFPELGIEILPERLTNTVVKPFAYEARIEVESQDLDGVMDAIDRLETLLGLLSTLELGRTVHWWSVIFDQAGGVLLTPDPGLVSVGLKRLDAMPEPARACVKRAAWWFRSQRSPMSDPSPSAFAQFMGAWNAFECLVEAVGEMTPLPTLTKRKKNRQVEEFFSQLGRPPTAADVSNCYQTIVDPRQKAKIRHALDLCYGGIANQYEEEMFGSGRDVDGLYDVRNDVHHGNIVENDLDSIMLMVRALSRIEYIALAVFHLVLGHGVLHDTTKRSCCTCRHAAEDMSCSQGRRPEDRGYWQFECAGFEAAEHYHPEDAFSWTAQPGGASTAK